MSNKDNNSDKDAPEDLKTIFEKYTGAAGSKGKILLKDAKKWFEEANIIGKIPGKPESKFEESFSTTAKDKVSMTFEEFKSYIQTLAKYMKVEANVLAGKLVASQKEITEGVKEKIEKAIDLKHSNMFDFEDIKQSFEKYTEAAGNKGTILLRDAKKWFEEANIIGKMPGKTESEFDESFATIAKDKVSMTYEEFKSYIQTLAKDMRVEANELINKLEASQKRKTEDVKGKSQKVDYETDKTRDKTEKH